MQKNCYLCRKATSGNDTSPHPIWKETKTVEHKVTISLNETHTKAADTAISEKADTAAAKKYKIGIALSGGGARGFAHAGALAALDEAGVKPDIIAGVSAGAIAATLYAAGIPPKEMLSRFSKKFTDYVHFSLKTEGGLLSLSKLKQFMLKNAGVQNLEDLKIPTYIGVTDFDHGVATEFHTGNLGDRVMASCSVPIVFKPVKIDGTNYVDGGVLRNLPAWTIRDKCEKLIGINCSPLPSFKYKKSIFEVAMRTFNLMSKTNQEPDMAMCDLVIKTPEIATYQVFNLKDIQKLYLSGYAAAHRAIKIWLKDNPL